MEQPQPAEPSLEWKFFQVFGEEQANRNVVEEIQEADLLSALGFDETGDYLATGDRGGRIVVFERSCERTATPEKGDKRADPRAECSTQYRFLAEFQSHEPEFDYLKSLEIEEKINSLRWCKGNMGCKMLLSTNDKTIKLWKVYGKKIKTVSNMNLDPQHKHMNGSSWGSRATATGAAPMQIDTLRLPLMSTCERVVTASPKRTYSNAHAYHINSLALNSDGESFMSCDDLRVNLWNLAISNCCFNIVDVKPSSMEALSEVITSADFHPSHCHTFLYSSSKGCVRLGDMRAAALCDRQLKVFEEPEEPSNRSFFSEITSSISNARFSRDGRYMVSRDYMTVRVWDVNMEAKPLKTIRIHEHLRPKLCDLYENDCIFDKFDACFNHDSQYVLTGSYNNTFQLLSTDGTQPNLTLEACKTPMRRRGTDASHRVTARGRIGVNGANGEAGEFTKRILHSAFHPHQNIIAIAATSTLYIFKA